jgi:hypothetical protein
VRVHVNGAIVNSAMLVECWLEAAVYLNAAHSFVNSSLRTRLSQAHNVGTTLPARIDSPLSARSFLMVASLAAIKSSAFSRVRAPGHQFLPGCEISDTIANL